MRILLVSHKYPPYAMGGVEVYTRNLAQALHPQHEIAVFFRHDDDSGPLFAETDDRDGGIFKRRVSYNPTGLGASVAGQFFETFLNRHIEDSFTRLLSQFQPDLVHVQHVMALSARLITLARQAGLPVVLTLHDYWFICSNSQLIWPDAQPCRGKAAGMNCVRCAAAARFPSRLVGPLRPALAPLFVYRDRVVDKAARQANHFVSPSRFLIDKYIAAGFPPDRFLFLENGLPLHRIRQFRWRPSDGPLRVTFLGSLAWQKGVHILAEAYRGLPPGTARLQIWGNPHVFPQYAQQLRQILPNPAAELKGPIANEHVGEVLADSDVMVVPSVWYENSPVVIQEARAAGLPVVVSGHGALAEKVQHGVNGLHFPPGDATALRRILARLAGDADLLAKLRQNIPAPMDMSEHAQRLEILYRQVMLQRQAVDG
ncbi:MAG: glycosyltransferase family 4 protein [Anaerolineae bacterium]|jgi:glycosyltransferase involved in cell wall biosynthesis